eukprot:scaffold139980_cov63-Attheya_sp.AAC.2
MAVAPEQVAHDNHFPLAVIIHPWSYGWKELHTLLETLQREHKNAAYFKSLMIYFTDNLVSYELLSKGSSGLPGLQELLREIKALEIEMHCQ